MKYHSLLGPDYETRISEIIEEELEDWAIGAYTDKKTGEIDRNWLKKVTEIYDEMRISYQQNLAGYERHATEMRQRNNMRPFNWAHESEDRIRQYIRRAAWQMPKLRTIEFQEPITLSIEQIQDDQYWCELTKMVDYIRLPEYRTARAKPATSRAKAALQEFETQQTITIERPIEEWERLHREWNDDIPEATQPIKKMEPINTCVAKVAKKYKDLFTEPEGPTEEQFEEFKKRNPFL